MLTLPRQETEDAADADPAGAEPATEEAANTIAEIVADPGEGLALVEESLASAHDWIVEHGPAIAMNLLAALVILLVGLWIAKAITGVLKRALTRRKIDATLVGFLSKIAYGGLMIVVVITALGALDVDTTSFAAMLAAAGLAVGLALQGSLGNLASGVMIIFFRPFRAGDYIEGGGTAGTVEDVGIFATVLKTPDNRKVIVPNGSITSDNITNYSANPTRRVDMVFGIGYGDDVTRAKEILERLLSEDPRVLPDPKPLVAVGDLGESSVNLLCRPWTNTADYWSLYWDFIERAKLAFDAAGITIPFPQRDVHLFREDESAA